MKHPVTSKTQVSINPSPIYPLPVLYKPEGSDEVREYACLFSFIIDTGVEHWLAEKRTRIARMPWVLAGRKRLQESHSEAAVSTAARLFAMLGYPPTHRRLVSLDGRQERIKAAVAMQFAVLTESDRESMYGYTQKHLRIHRDDITRPYVSDKQQHTIFGYWKELLEEWRANQLTSG